MSQLRFLSAADSNTQASATSDRSLQLGSARVDSSGSLQSALDLINQLPELPAAIARIMLVTGARAHEILNLEVKDVGTTGHILVRAGKGSDSRVCYCPDVLPFRRQAISNQQTRLFHHFSYHKLRRAFKAAAKSSTLDSTPTRLVTNLLRRAAADLSDSFGGQDHSLAQRFLGHRSPSSTLYYLSPGK